ncbi:ATP-grasp fold amidoligase family protein [Winogradskyella ursingii]|uniref:ATP-grasp fold amidoligase family protein n=1 Tax=Winogradskyella ursingii TaxID=2686079 RepID=UPI0015CDADB1|nr:ATP-grasp fold amidoligase family protein [Winogradskyella ursingii]
MKTLRNTITKVTKQSELGYYLLRPVYMAYDFSLRLIPDEVIVKNSFKKHMGYKLDLNNPKTLNEKINWLKLYERKEHHTIIADKYAVREYIKEKIGEQYLVPLYFHTKNHKELRSKNLPDKNFIIKTNHDSSGGVIVTDKSEIKWKKVRKRFKRLLKENHYFRTREWQYKNIKPRIIVEKLLTNKDGSIPNDFKFHCFNGKLAFVMVDLNRHIGKRTRNLYDKDWNLLPCEWGRPNDRDMEKPSNLEEMIKLSEILAKDFPYLRVDFYSVKGKTYFGELTLHHASGFQKFTQEEYDYKFGKELKLDIHNE